MAKKKTYQWFIEPIGNAAHSNDVIRKYPEGSDEDAGIEYDKQGHPHPVWQRTHMQMMRLRASQETTNAKINVWRRLGSHGPIEYVGHLLPLGKSRKKKEMRETFKGARPVNKSTINSEENIPF